MLLALENGSTAPWWGAGVFLLVMILAFVVIPVAVVLLSNRDQD